MKIFGFVILLFNWNIAYNYPCCQIPIMELSWTTGKRFILYLLRIVCGLNVNWSLVWQSYEWHAISWKYVVITNLIFMYISPQILSVFLAPIKICYHYFVPSKVCLQQSVINKRNKRTFQLCLLQVANVRNVKLGYAITPISAIDKRVNDKSNNYVLQLHISVNLWVKWLHPIISV